MKQENDNSARTRKVHRAQSNRIRTRIVITVEHDDNANEFTIVNAIEERVASAQLEFFGVHNVTFEAIHRRMGRIRQGPNRLVSFSHGFPVSTVIRDHLRWSWNYALAESMADDTFRHNARWIASGIVRGEDVSDFELIEDFVLKRRTPEGEITAEWLPDDDALRAELLNVIQQQLSWVAAQDAQDNG